MAGKRKKKKEARFGELDAYLFGQATHYDIYQKMGAHLDVKDGVRGVWFTVWAPNAQGNIRGGRFQRLGG